MWNNRHNNNSNNPRRFSLALVVVPLFSLVLCPYVCGQQGGGGGGSTTIPGPTASGQCFISTNSGSGNWTWGSCSGSSNLAFSSLTSGTNTAMAGIVGSGASLTASGTGTITATNTQAVASFAPTVDGVFGVNTTTHLPVFGSNGTTLIWPQTAGPTANEFITAFSQTTGQFTLAQPAFSNLSGTATTAQLPATVVYNNQSNTFSTGIQDLSAAAQVKLPVAAGYTSAANGEVGYDSTNNNWHLWQNGSDAIMGIFSGSVTTGDCLKVVVSSNVQTIQDAGSTCGGNPPFSAITTATNTTATMTVGTGATLTFSGSGVVNANEANGGTFPASATVLGTNSSSQPVAASVTGTGNVVLATSPTLVTPNLGTPSAVTLTNATGLPVSTGISGLGSGVATWLGTPSATNLGTALGSQTANFFFAAPNGSNGNPAFRAIVAADIPTLNQNTTGTAAGLTGCTTSTAGSVCYWNGSAWTVFAGNTSGTGVFQETSSGVPSWNTSSASSIFTSYQFGTQTPLTGSGLYLQTTYPSLFSLSQSGSGTSGSPYIDAIVLANQSGNTSFGNWTNGSAAPVFNAVASCSGNNSAEQWTFGTGLTCGTSFAQLNIPQTFTATQTLQNILPSADATYSLDTSGVRWMPPYFSGLTQFDTMVVGANGLVSQVANGITGQVYTSTNNSNPAFSSPSLIDSTGSPISTTPYSTQCDSSSTTIDRSRTLLLQSGAGVVNVSTSTGAGCSGMAMIFMDDGAGTVTFNRGGSDTFRVFNGSTNSDAQTSFTLNNGQYVSLNQNATNSWEVRISPLPGTVSATLAQPVVGTGSNVTSSPAQWYADQFTASTNCSPGSGGEIDGCLNAANAWALTTGIATIDARGLNNTQNLLNEVDIGKLPPPTLTASGSGSSLTNTTYYVVYCLLSTAFSTCPSTTGNTMSGNMVSWSAQITPTAGQNIVVTAPVYAGSATQWAVAMGTANAAYNSGTQTAGIQYCATSATSITSNITLTAACSTTNTVNTIPNSNTASLLVPHDGIWVMSGSGHWSAYGSAPSSYPNTGQGTCGLRFFNQSAAIGDSTGEGRSWYIETPGTGITAVAPVCTDTNSGLDNNGFYRVDGIATVVQSGDTISAGGYVYGTVDISTFPNFHAGVHTAIPALLVQNACCGMSFPHAQLEGNSVASPGVLELGGTSLANSGGKATDFNCEFCSVVHPASNAASIISEGNSLATFPGEVYLEYTTSTCTADAIQFGTVANEPAGLFLFDTIRIGGSISSPACFAVEQGTNTVKEISWHGIDLGNFENVLHYAPNTALNLTVGSTAQIYPPVSVIAGTGSPSVVVGNTSITGTLNLTGQLTNTFLTTAGLLTTTSGGAVGSEANCTIAQGCTNATTAAAGEVANSSSGTASAWTPTVTLGVPNSTAGSVTVANNAANASTTWGSAATSNNTILGPATVPTNGHLIYCSTSSVTCTLTDAGYSFNAIPFADLTISATNIGSTLAIAQYSVIYSNGTAAAPLGLAAPTTNGDWFSGYHITGSAASAPVTEQLVASTTNSDGLTVTPTYNATGPTQRFEVTGNYSGTLANGVTATTQTAGNNSTDVATTAYVNTIYNLIQTSGSPYTMSQLTGTYWNNTTGAYSFDLPTPAAGLQFCFGNYQARTSAVSIIPGSGVTIYFKGAAGTAGSSTGLVSGGAAGDFICVEATDTTTYMAIGAGYGTWTNH